MMKNASYLEISSQNSITMMKIWARINEHTDSLSLCKVAIHTNHSSKSNILLKVLLFNFVYLYLNIKLENDCKR